MHGDDKGLRFPWKIAPLQVIIVLIEQNELLLKEAKKIKEELDKKEISAEIDNSEKRPGEKFYFWEMKGVPLRVELGINEIKNKKLTIFRRDINKKETITRKELLKYIEKIAEDIDKNLTKEANHLFDNSILEAKNQTELKKVIDSGKIARCGFCSVEMKGMICAEKVEKEVLASVRGTKLEKENFSEKTSKCVICGERSNHIVYIAKSY